LQEKGCGPPTGMGGKTNEAKPAYHEIFTSLVQFAMGDTIATVGMGVYVVFLFCGKAFRTALSFVVGRYHLHLGYINAWIHFASLSCPVVLYCVSELFCCGRVGLGL
jgi:hypothetical protein